MQLKTMINSVNNNESIAISHPIRTCSWMNQSKYP